MSKYICKLENIIKLCGNSKKIDAKHILENKFIQNKDYIFVNSKILLTKECYNLLSGFALGQIRNIKQKLSKIDSIDFLAKCLVNVCDFERNYKKNISPYIVDLYLPKYNIAVVNGYANSKKNILFIKDKLKCDMAIFNPNDLNFDLACFVNMILTIITRKKIIDVDCLDCKIKKVIDDYWLIKIKLASNINSMKIESMLIKNRIGCIMERYRRLPRVGCLTRGIK